MPNSVKLPIQLYINEFMADNDAIIADPQGEYDDWIELYNAGEQYVSLAGKYITDDLSDPTDFKVKDNALDSTMILPGEFLLLWADENEIDGVLHLGIKLSTSGEHIGVFDEDGITELDSYSFGPQITDISFGRIPDGGEAWVLMSDPTPGESNVHDIILDLKVVLEGPFNGLDMNTDLAGQNAFPFSQPYNTNPWNYPGDEAILSVPASAVDWVLVELREASEASLAYESTIRETLAGFVLKDGTVTDISGTNMLSFKFNYSDSLYAVVKHRNHLSVMTAFALKENLGVYTYDLSSSSVQSYGMNSTTKLSYGIWGMFSGDVDASDQIDMTDKDPNWEIDAGLSGYLDSDLNLDTQSNNKDKNDIWLPNLGKWSMVPE